MEYLRIPKRREDFKKLVRKLIVQERKRQKENLYSTEKLFDDLPVDRVVAMFRTQDRDRVFKLAYDIDHAIYTNKLYKSLKKNGQL